MGYLCHFYMTKPKSVACRAAEVGEGGRKQEAIALGRILNWQGEDALEGISIFDHLAYRFDFLFMLLSFCHARPFSVFPCGLFNGAVSNSH